MTPAHFGNRAPSGESSYDRGSWGSGGDIGMGYGEGGRGVGGSGQYGDNQRMLGGNEYDVGGGDRYVHQPGYEELRRRSDLSYQ